MDWFALFSNSLWIVGLAVILSTSSVAYWQALRKGVHWNKVINQTNYQYTLNYGFIGFSFGLALSLTTLILRVFWFALALLLILRILYLRKSDES